MASLYERLGGASGISRVVDDVVTAHMANPVIRARFLPYLEKEGRIAELKAHTCAFLGAGSGGPEQYKGRGMKDAHRGMNINEAEYMATIDDILMVLNQHDIDQQTCNDILAIAYSLKGEILRV
ncbi:MAG: group 1 truncated hemoglobin [Steroidobacteraceae bacterium]